MITLSNDYRFEYLTASGSLGFDLKGWPQERPLIWLRLIRPELFANVIKTLTRYPRKGNLRWWKPWTYVSLISGGVVNKVGLSNKGIDWWCTKVAPKINFDSVGVIGSIFGSEDDLVYMAGRLKNFPLKALEINFSCPNSGDSLPDTATIIKAVKRVKTESDFPLILKLSASQDYLTLASELLVIVEAISFNSVPWKEVFPRRRSPLWRLEEKVGGGGGGVSGRPAQKINWRAVRAVAEQGLIPVIAPNVMSYKDIARVRRLGAKAVSFGVVHLPSYPVWFKPWTVFTNPCRPTVWVKRMGKSSL